MSEEPVYTVELDIQEIIKRAIKYLVEGGAVAIAAFIIPKRKMANKEILLIAVTAAAVLAILDTFSPGVAIGARHGAGFGIGAGLVGGLGIGETATPAPTGA